VFGPGSVSGAVQTVTLGVLDDLLLEGNETVDLALTGTSGPGVTLGTQLNHQVTIIDDESAQIQFVAPGALTPESVPTEIVSLELVAAPGVTVGPGVSVSASVTDAGTGSATAGSDYTPFGVQSVVFGPGSVSGAVQTVTLGILDDLLVEADETVELLITGTTGSGVTAGSLSNHTVTILDDDTGGPTDNLPPVITSSTGDSIDEGSTATVSIVFSDPDTGDSHSASVDWGDGGLIETFSSVSSPFTPSHIYGDNGSFTVLVTITDVAGESDSVGTTVNVANLDSTLVLDEGGSLAFHGGDAFIGRVGTPQDHVATATDPGSDDLTFYWNGIEDDTYWNDGIGPDPASSPDGTFPFTVTDTGTVNYAAPGVFSVDVTVEDDDAGTASDSLTKVITGDCDCAKSKGYWKQQFDSKKLEKGKTDIDPATLDAYLDIVGFGSWYFTPGMTLADANLVFDPPKSNNGGSNNGNSNVPASKAGTNDASTVSKPKNKKGKGDPTGAGDGASTVAAPGGDESISGTGGSNSPSKLAKTKNNAEQQILAAWLNFAKGAIEWNTELIDTDGDGIGDMTFEDLVHEVEMILLDPDATKVELNHAKDLAEAVNHHDDDGCETGTGSGSVTGSDDGSEPGSDDGSRDESKGGKKGK
ncbi:MAG: hypothetical protein HOB07_01355, partial [Chloroflexi bacterium]|nr:hypothetical protein [Chloroflexota bacterium]